MRVGHDGRGEPARVERRGERLGLRLRLVRLGVGVETVAVAVGMRLGRRLSVAKKRGERLVGERERLRLGVEPLPALLAPLLLRRPPPVRTLTLALGAVALRLL